MRATHFNARECLRRLDELDAELGAPAKAREAQRVMMLLMRGPRTPEEHAEIAAMLARRPSTPTPSRLPNVLDILYPRGSSAAAAAILRGAPPTKTTAREPE